jgi:signal transduction histidine kinase
MNLRYGTATRWLKLPAPMAWARGHTRWLQSLHLQIPTARYSIRSCLLGLTGVALFPALAGLVWLLVTAVSAERTSQDHALREATRMLALRVDHELDRRAAIARALASAPLPAALEQIPHDPVLLQPFEAQARAAMAGLGGWVELSLRGRKILDTRSPIGTALDEPTPAGETLPNVATVTPLKTTRPDQPAHAALIQPVPREGHATLHVALTLLPSELQALVDPASLPAEWVSVVLDQRGAVLARYPGGASFTGRAISPDLKELLAARREGWFDATAPDGSAIAGYFSTSQGWTTLTTMPSPQGAAGIPALVWQVGLGMLALLGGAACAALWMGARLTTPFASIQQTAVQLKEGQVVTAQTTGLMEIDAAMQALADASHTLQQHQNELAQQRAAADQQAQGIEQQASQNQRIAALGRLTDSVAHDFNNLLGVISNSAYLIQRKANSEMEMALGATRRAVDAGSHLTQQLQRFAAQRPTAPQAIAPHRFLSDHQAFLSMVLGRRIHLHIEAAPDTAAVHADPSELELALVTLALNAREALPNGGPIRLKAANAEPQDTADLPPAAYVAISMVVGEHEGGDGTVEGQSADTPNLSDMSLHQVQRFCLQAGGRVRIAAPTQKHGTVITLILPTPSV